MAGKDKFCMVYLYVKSKEKQQTNKHSKTKQAFSNQGQGLAFQCLPITSLEGLAFSIASPGFTLGFLCLKEPSGSWIFTAE